MMTYDLPLIGFSNACLEPSTNTSSRSNPYRFMLGSGSVNKDNDIIIRKLSDESVFSMNWFNQLQVIESWVVSVKE